MDSDPYLGVDVYVDASRSVRLDWRPWVSLGLVTTAAIMTCVIAGSVLSIWVDGLLPAVFGVVWCWCTGTSVGSVLAAGPDDRHGLRQAVASAPWRRIAGLSTVLAALTTLGVHLWLLPALAVIALGWFAPVLVAMPGVTVPRALADSALLGWENPLDLVMLSAIAGVVTVISVGSCTVVLPLSFPVLALATHRAAHRIAARTSRRTG